MSNPPVKIGKFGARSEHDEIDYLPDDEKRRDVKADDLPKFHRRHIERKSVAEKESCPAYHKGSAQNAGMVENRQSRSRPRLLQGWSQPIGNRMPKKSVNWSS